MKHLLLIFILLPVYVMCQDKKCDSGWSFMPSIGASSLKIIADTCLPDSIVEQLYKLLYESANYGSTGSTGTIVDSVDNSEVRGKKYIIYTDSLGEIIPYTNSVYLDHWQISDYDTVIYKPINYDSLRLNELYKYGIYISNPLSDTLWQCDREVDTIPVFNDYPDSLMKIELLIDSTDTTVTQKDSYKEYINYILYFYYDIDYYEDGDLFVMIKPKNNYEL